MVGPSWQGVFIFLCAIRRHFLACQDIVGGTDLSAEGNFFHKIQRPSGGSQMSGGRIIILRVIRTHFLVCGRGPSCQPLHVQSTSDGCRSLTTLTTPCESTRAVDDGEAYKGNDTEPGKTRQWLPTQWGVRGLTGSAAVAGK